LSTLGNTVAVHAGRHGGAVVLVVNDQVPGGHQRGPAAVAVAGPDRDGGHDRGQVRQFGGVAGAVDDAAVVVPFGPV
jgi:hypothetical protein